MKPILLLFILSISTIASAQSVASYDKALAEKLGADDYGMKQYVLVILKTGSNKTEDTAQLQRLFRGHMDNISRLANEGKLIVAGPLGNNEKNYRGIFILNVKDTTEANELLVTDPAVKEKLFETELYEWYGSAALPEYLPYHEKIQKKNF